MQAVGGWEFFSKITFGIYDEGKAQFLQALIGKFQCPKCGLFLMGGHMLESSHP